MMFTTGLDEDPLNLVLLFYRAISYLDINEPENTIKDLICLLNIKPDYNKLAYLILSIAHKRMHNDIDALNVLWQGIKYFPKYSETYLARALLYMQLKNYEDALNDFQNFNKYANK